jgi:hypothetical protein
MIGTPFFRENPGDVFIVTQKKKRDNQKTEESLGFRN